MKISTTFSIAAASVLFASLLVLSSIPATAQITLTQQNVPLTAQAFTFDSLHFAAFQSPVAGEDQTWNFAKGATITAHYAEQLYRSTDPAFSANAIYDTIGFEPLTTAVTKAVTKADTTFDTVTYGINYHEIFDQFNGPVSSFIVHPAISLPTQAYNIDAASSGSNDSLWITAQDDFYTSPDDTTLHQPDRYLALPATFRGYWVSNPVRRVMDMKVRIASLSFFGYSGITDFKKASIFSSKDSVAGWGTVAVPANGSNPIPALMVRRAEMRVDSFFLNDSLPTAAFILQSFHLGEGMDSTTYSDAFFVEGSVLPILTINYSDSTYEKPTAIYSYASPQSSVAENVTSVSGMHLYPNPSHAKNFYVQLSTSLTPNDRIELADMTGKAIEFQQMASTLNGTVVPIALAPSTPAGTYFIRVIRADGSSDQSKIVVAP